jgi:hypothetical protein
VRTPPRACQVSGSPQFDSFSLARHSVGNYGTIAPRAAATASPGKRTATPPITIINAAPLTLALPLLGANDAGRSNEAAAGDALRYLPAALKLALAIDLARALAFLHVSACERGKPLLWYA